MKVTWVSSLHCFCFMCHSETCKCRYKLLILNWNKWASTYCKRQTRIASLCWPKWRVLLSDDSEMASLFKVSFCIRPSIFLRFLERLLSRKYCGHTHHCQGWMFPSLHMWYILVELISEKCIWFGRLTCNCHKTWFNRLRVKMHLLNILYMV